MPNESGTTRRLKLIVAYDGSGFAGWQSQRHGNGIQDHLEAALKKICGCKVAVHGAGRTDAGVHASGQCAHSDLPPNDISPESWRAALNANLPPQIRVLRCRFVPRSFHARFSAKGKLYRYRIWNDAVLPPMEFNRAWHVVAPLNEEIMERCASIFVGTHDFARFAANRGKPPESSVRTLSRIQIRRAGPLVTIDFCGDGFLYKMVRFLAGAIVRSAARKLSIEQVAAQLHDSAPTGPRFVAPACGLTLVRVIY